jgi:hypothetical protein
MAFTPIDEEEIINEPVAEEAKPRFIPIEDDEFFGIVGEEEAPEPAPPLGAPAPAEAPKSRFTPISDDEFFGIETPKEEPQQPSDWDTLRGAEVALRQVPQLAYGVAGLVGATSEQITGYGEALRDFGFRGYKEWEESMEPISKETDDITVAWDRAKEGDVGALVDWAQYGVGYALGQLGETAAVAVLGGLAGAATGAPAGGVGAVPAAAGGAIAAAATKQGFKALARDLVEKAIAKPQKKELNLPPSNLPNEPLKMPSSVRLAKRLALMLPCLVTPLECSLVLFMVRLNPKPNPRVGILRDTIWPVFGELVLPLADWKVWLINLDWTC